MPRGDAAPGKNERKAEKPRKPRQTEWPIGDVELAVIMRERPASGREPAAIVLSSRAFAGERNLYCELATGEIRAILGPADVQVAKTLAPAPTIPLAGESHGASDRNQHDQNNGASASAPSEPPLHARLARWLEGVAGRRQSLAMIMSERDQLVWRGDRCDDCRLEQFRGFALLGRNLPESAFQAAKSELHPTLKSAADTLIDFAEGVRRHWPPGVAVRSLAACWRDGSGDPVKWRVDLDPAGQAQARLLALRRAHEGDVRGPKALALAWQAYEAGDAALRQTAAMQARSALTLAVTEQSGMPRWHAQLALACALANAHDGAAVKEIQTALHLAPRDIEVLELASRVMWVRGQHDEARRLLSMAIGQRPGASHLQARFEAMRSESPAQAP